MSREEDMPKIETTATRRSVFFGLGAMIAMSGAAMAGPMAPMNVWAGRPLRGDQRMHLSLFGDALRANLTGYPIEVKMLNDHLRLRVAADYVFETSESAVQKNGRRLLTVLAEEILRKGDLRAEVVVHHDTPDASFRAFIISERRAEAVVSVLRTRQVPPNHIKATGLGDRFPLVSGVNTGERVKNSRIEILFRPL